MKIKKIKNNKINVINSFLLNLKVYLSIYTFKSYYYKNQDTIYVEFKINKLVLHLKKCLTLLYQFHCNKKNILFVGFKKSKNIDFFSLFNNLNYPQLSIAEWVNGMFNNNNTIKKKNFSKYSKYLLIKSLKTKPDLIITPLSNTIKVLGLETKKLKIPVLCLFPDLFM